MISGKSVRAIGLVAGLASLCTCESPTPPEQFGAVALHMVSAPGGLVALDAGRVHVRGPTPKDINATPGTQVTIDQLDPGDYTVALEGLIANEVAKLEVANFVEINNVHVDAGRTTSATVSSFPSFVPAITSLPSTGTSKTFTVGFSGVTGAQSYEVEAATDAGFTVNHVTQATAQSPATVTVPTYGSYLVRVRAIDAYLQGRGKPSPAQSITLVAQAADLVVSTPALTVTPGSVTQGNTVTVGSFTVTNQGTAASNAGVIGFYLSSDATITTGDTPLGTVNLPALSSGASFNAPAQQLIIPVATPPQGYFIGVVVDGTNQTPESDEGNNTKSTALTVIAQSADLVISTPTLTVTPGIVTQGNSVTMGAFTVLNQGTATSSPGVVGFYLSSDTTITAADTRLAGVNVGVLAPNGTFNVPAQLLAISATTAPGNFFVGALVDETNQTTESNEGNNSKSTTLLVKVIFQVDSVQPLVNATGVETGAVVVARFSDGVNAATLTDSSFKVSVGGTALATKVSYDPNTRIAQLSAPLLPGSTYLTTVTAGVQDTAGRPLAAPRQWSFSTGVPRTLVVGAGGHSPSLVLRAGEVHLVHDLNWTLRYSFCSGNCTSGNWTSTIADVVGGAGSLVLDGGGRLYTSYDHDGDLGYSTCVVSCTLPGNWPYTILVSSAKTGQWPSLAFDGARLHVIWMDHPLRPGLKYATCAAGGVGCESAAAWDTVIVDAAGDVDAPSLTLDGNGTLHVSYAASALGLRYATCPASTKNCAITTNWQKVTVDPGVRLPWLNDKTTIGVEPTGRLHVAYFDSTSGNLKYATCASACTTSGNWQRVAVVYAGINGGSPSLVIDGLGRLHVTYYHSDTRALKYATCAAACTSPTHWQTATLDQSIPKDVGATSAVQIDPIGRLHVGYEDRTDPLNPVLDYMEF